MVFSARSERVLIFFFFKLMSNKPIYRRKKSKVEHMPKEVEMRSTKNCAHEVLLLQ